MMRRVELTTTIERPSNPATCRVGRRDHRLFFGDEIGDEQRVLQVSVLHPYTESGAG